MSVTITLIPLALAAAGLMGGGGLLKAATVLSDDDRPRTRDAEPAVRVRTRMKDLDLLEDALDDIGATEVEASGDAVHAEIDGLDVTMSRDADGVWQSRFAAPGRTDAALRQAGTDVIERLDAAYALRVQQAVAARIRDRAEDAGFELANESHDDDTVTMVLTVRTGG